VEAEPGAAAKIAVEMVTALASAVAAMAAEVDSTAAATVDIAVDTGYLVVVVVAAASLHCVDSWVVVA